MARSPDYLRLATNATRTLAESAFDGIREAVLVVDVRAKHLPVVLANRAAGGCLTSSDSEGLVDSSLYGFLGASAASVIESATASLSEARPAVTQPLTWRSTGEETAYSTELKLLDSAPNQRLVMFTFNPQVPCVNVDIGPAVEQLPLSLLILDRNLEVTYANATAMHASGVAGSLIGRSALTVRPANALPGELYQRALEGHSHFQGLQAPWGDGAERYLLIAVQPLSGAAGVEGVIVLSGDMSAGALHAARSEGVRYLQSLIEDSMDILSIAGPDGRLLCASRGAHAVFGYPADAQNPPTIFDFLNPEDARHARVLAAA
jgi:PAS domain-containing protein